MKNLFCQITILYLFTISATSQENKELRILFAGDIMCHDTQLKSAWDSTQNKYNFDGYFKELQPLLSSVDLAMANLETTFPGSRYSGYPEFRSPDDLLMAIRKAGFNLLFTANNHAYDSGYFGLARTIRLLNQLNIQHTGTSGSAEERDLLSPLILEKKGFRIAFINYSYGVNSENVPFDYLINTMDTLKMHQDIQKARLAGVDIIIAFLHWGTEYMEQPDDRQKQMAAFLHNNGIPIVIGSHPHVVQPVEFTHKGDEIETVTAYSLGNLISNQRSGNTKKGLVLELTIGWQQGQIRIKEVILHPTLVKRKRRDRHYDYEITLPSSHVPS